MELVFGDLLVGVEIEGEEQVISPHSGRSILNRSFDIRARKTERTAPVLDALSKLENGSVLTERLPDGTDRKWRVTEHSHSSRQVNDGPVSYIYRLSAVEDETRTPEALVLNDLRLVPYRFNERSERDGTITIEARVRLAPDESGKLLQLMEGANQVAVVREGIQTTPRQMRFGQCLWSKDEDHVKHSLLLIETVPGRPHKSFRLLEPQFFNTQRAALHSTLTVRALLGKLEEKGIISQAEAQEVATHSQDALIEEYKQFRRVNDVDEWLDDDE